MPAAPFASAESAMLSARMRSGARLALSRRLRRMGSGSPLHGRHYTRPSGHAWPLSCCAVSPEDCLMRKLFIFVVLLVLLTAACQQRTETVVSDTGTTESTTVSATVPA